MKKDRIFIVAAALFCLTIAGCDQISSTIESIFNKNKKTTASTSEDKAVQPPPVKTSTEKIKDQASAAAALNTQADVLASVGSWSITVDEFKDRLKNLKDVVPDFDIKKPESKKLVLDELVRQQLMVMDAEEKGLGNKKEIQDAVSEFRRTLLVRENVNNLITSVTVTDNEVQDYFNQNKNMFVEPAEYHLRAIVVPTQPEAKDILVDVLKGADFAQTAQARSKGKTAAKGGDLGLIKGADLDQATAAAVLNLEVGDVSAVFKGSEGYSIVKLEEKKGGKQLGFLDVKNDIKNGLLQIKQQQTVESYLKELEQKKPVTRNESLLEGVKL